MRWRTSMFFRTELCSGWCSMPIFAVFFTCRLTVNLKTRRSLTLPLCLHPSTSQSKLVPLQPCPAAQCGERQLKMRRIINSHVCKLGKPCTMVQSGCGYVDPSCGKLWANIATATFLPRAADLKLASRFLCLSFPSFKHNENPQEETMLGSNNTTPGKPSNTATLNKQQHVTNT